MLAGSILLVTLLSGEIAGFELALNVSDEKLPPEIAGGLITAVVADDGDEEAVIYLLVRRHIFKYDLEADKIELVTAELEGQYFGAVWVRGVGAGRLFYVAAGSTQVWAHDGSRDSDPEEWTTLAAAQPITPPPVAVYSPDSGYAYVLGTPGVSIQRFCTTADCGVEEAESVEQTVTAGVWDSSMAVGVGYFLAEPVVGNTNTIVLKYDEVTQLPNDTIGRLSYKATLPCAMWIQRHLYVLCGNPGDPQENLVRFDPSGGDTVPVHVAGLDVERCGLVGCAYSRKLDRIYMFGGMNSPFTDMIAFIQLEEDELTTTSTTEVSTSLTSTTEEPSTSEDPPTTEEPSTTEGASTTEELSTTEEASTTEELSTTKEASTTEELSTTKKASTTEEPDTELTSTTEESSTTELTSTTEKQSTTDLTSTTSGAPSTTEFTSTTVESTSTELTSTTEEPFTATTELTTTETEAESTTELMSTTEEPSTAELTSTTAKESMTDLTSAKEAESTTELSTTEEPPSTELTFSTEMPPTSTHSTVMPSTISSRTVTSPSTSTDYSFSSATPTVSPPAPGTTSTTSTPSTTPTPSKATTTTTDEPEVSPAPGCNATDCQFGLRYTASVGQSASNPCPAQSDGVATWLCVAPAKFDGPTPDYNNCSSRWIRDVLDQIQDVEVISPGSASELLRSVHENITESMSAGNSTYFGHEIRILLQIGVQILELVDNRTAVEEFEMLTGSTYAIYDSILHYFCPWGQLSKRNRSESATCFLYASDKNAIELGNRWRHAQNASVPYRRCFNSFSELEIMSGVELTSRNRRLTFPNRFQAKKDSYIELAPDWPTAFPNRDVPFAGLSLSPERANTFFPVNISQMKGSEVKFINGKLMSFTFGADEVQLLDRNLNQAPGSTQIGVTITFRHDVPAFGPKQGPIRRDLHAGEVRKAVSGSAVCMYWDTANLVWSPEGCSLVTSGVDVTVCKCDHLTSFALIMDFHDYIGHDPVLEILTWVLCSFSMVCYILSIYVFVYNRFGGKELLRKHPRNNLTFCICVLLLLANVLVMTTLDRHFLHLSDAACIASALALHYLLLCAFAWMALEGIMLAKLVFIDVFSSGSEYAGLEWAGAFGVPAIIVGVTCGFNFGRADHGYGNEAYCWLDGAYQWSFIGVVVPILIFNAGVLLMTFRKSGPSRHITNSSRRGSQLKGRNSSRRLKAVRAWLCGALSLTLVTGLTWISGFLVLLNYPTVAHVAAYVFTVTNASQGVLIFVFHIVTPHEKVRAHFWSIVTRIFRRNRGIGRRSTTANPILASRKQS